MGDMTHSPSAAAWPPPSPLPHRTSRKSIALGALSIAPLTAAAVALLGFVADFVVTVRSFDSPHSDTDVVGPFLGGGLVFVLLGLSGVAAIVALVVLLVDVFANPVVPDQERVIWLLCLLFASVVAFPVYWYVVWWRRLPSAPG